MPWIVRFYTNLKFMPAQMLLSSKQVLRHYDIIHIHFSIQQLKELWKSIICQTNRNSWHTLSKLRGFIMYYKKPWMSKTNDVSQDSSRQLLDFKVLFNPNINLNHKKMQFIRQLLSYDTNIKAHISRCECNESHSCCDLAEANTL